MTPRIVPCALWACALVMLVGLGCGCTTQEGIATIAPGEQGRAETAPSGDPSPHGAGASITIRAVQGTKNGPKITGGDVTVELFHQGQMVRRMKARLDANGQTVLKDLPVMARLQPRVTIEHGGVFYQAVGRDMDALHRHQTIAVKVYETADQTPPWEVAMRHIILQPSADWLDVVEMLVVRNPTDRAWLGPPNDHGFRASVALDLPADARDVSLGGALDVHWAKLVGRRLYHTRPFVPGVSHLSLSYRIPAANGQARMEVIAPAPVKRLMVLLPDDDSRFQAEGLEPTSVPDARQKNTRAYKASGELPTGRQTVLIFGSGVDRSATVSKILAVIGAGLVLILCVVILVMKPSKNRKAGLA